MHRVVDVIARVDALQRAAAASLGLEAMRHRGEAARGRRVVADVASKEWSDPTVVDAAIAADAAFAPFVAAARGVLESAVADDGRVDRAWVEEALSFPGVGALVQRLKPIDPLLVHAVVKARSISHWSPYDPVGVVNADP